MFASQKPRRPRSLSISSSTAKIVIASTSKLPQLAVTPSFHRAFSWGVKSKWGSSHAGKVHKGFYIRHGVAQGRHIKPTCSETIDRHFLNISRSRSSLGFRSTSSWKKPDDLEQSASRKRENEEEVDEDWYSRWERQKRKQYEEFVKRIEQDPYHALFGASNRWLGWLDANLSGTRQHNHPDSGGQGNGSASKAEKTGQGPPPVKESAAGTSTVSASSASGRAGPGCTITTAAVFEEQDYEIDPITLRKVPKQSARQAPETRRPAQSVERAVNIPVKTFKPSSASIQSDQASKIPASQSGDSSNRTVQTTQSSLAQEDLGSKEDPSAFTTSTAQPNTSNHGDHVVSRIESALDRHVRGNDAKTLGARTPISDYQPKENRQDDVDLLRASDVRASAGLRGRQVKDTDVGKQTRQKALEDQYDRRPSELEDRLAQEIASSRKNEGDRIASLSNAVSNADAPSSTAPAASTEQSSKTSTPQVNPVLTSGQVGKIRAKLVPLKTKIDLLKEDYAALRQRLLEAKRRIEETARKKADKRALELLDQEVKTQKAAMQAIEMRQGSESKGRQLAPTAAHEELHGEGDMASNVHEFAGRARWYKRKAPHAQCELDAKLQRLAREKAFVREIRDIYEEKYGTIDVNHRQPLSLDNGSKDASTITNDSSSPSIQDARLTSPISHDGQADPKSAGLDANDLLPIRKELSAELQSLQFAIEDSTQRARGESDMQKLHAIHQALCRSAERCSRKLILAGRRIGSSIDDAPTTSSSPTDFFVRQSSLTSLDSSSTPPSTVLYRILAYDHSAQKVNSAKTASQASFVGEKPLTPLQALNMLDNPGKFLPHLMTLHNKGYDIVSGANNILVLKKVRDAVDTKEDYLHRPNPIDGTTTPEVSTGNFASPTGFVNHNPVIQPEELEQQQPSPPHSTDKVRREEDVFSGQSRRNWHDGKRMTKKDKRKARRRKTLKRMLMTGTITAAACYATGVVVEMMHV